MNTNKGQKIAIIGAGFVGAASAYAIALRQVCSELVLIDVAVDKAAGEADDIKHALGMLGNIKLYSGGYECVKDANIIVITAGAARKPGMTRLDLAKINIGIAKSITDELKKHYNGGVILVVANPVDILTYAVTKWMDLPAGMVFGSGTSLDSVRLCSAIGEMTGADVTNINAFMLGEHGDSQVPAWSMANIRGIKLDEFCKMSGVEFNDEVKEAIRERVAKDGGNIIKRKGATYYGVAVCVAILCQAVLRDQGTVFGVSTVMNGQYGISDVSVSLPSIVGANGVSKVFTPELCPTELELLVKSAEACKNTLSGLEI